MQQQKKNEEIGMKESFNIVFSLLCIHKNGADGAVSESLGCGSDGTPLPVGVRAAGHVCGLLRRPVHVAVGWGVGDLPAKEPD